MARILKRVDDWFWRDVDTRRVVNSRFGCCAPRAGNVLLFTWKGIGLGYIGAIEVFNWVDSSNPGRHISYLTNISMWLVLLYLLLSLSAIIWALVAQSRGRNDRSCCTPSLGSFAWTHLLRACQVLFDIAIPFQVVVVALYWALVYTAGDNSQEFEWFLDITQHGAACTFIWIDLLISRMRLPDRHSIIAFMAAVVYVCWNAGYTLTQPPALYSVLTWTGVSSAYFSIGAVAGVCIMFFVGSAISALLEKLSRRPPLPVGKEIGQDKVLVAIGVTETPKAGPSMNVDDDTFEESFPRNFFDEDIAFPCSSCRCCLNDAPANKQLVADGLMMVSIISPAPHSPGFGDKKESPEGAPEEKGST